MKKQRYDIEDIIRDCEVFNRVSELYDEGFTEIFDSTEWKNHLRKQSL